MFRIGLVEAGILVMVFLFLCVVAPRHAFSAESRQVQVAQVPVIRLQLSLPQPAYQPVAWQESMLAPVPARPRGQRHVVLHDAPSGQADLLLGARRGALQTYFERKW